MGIVKMNHISVVGLAREREALLAALSKLGAVEIRENPELSQAYRRDRRDELQELSKTQAERQLLESIIPTCRELLPYKKPMFHVRRSISVQSFMRYEEAAQRELLLSEARDFRENRRELQENQAQQAACCLQMEALEPWKKTLGSEDPSSSLRIRRWLGRLANQAQFNQLQNELRESMPTAVLTVLHQIDPKQPVQVLLAAPASTGEEALILAQMGGFKILTQRSGALTPQEEYEQLQQKLEKLKEEAAQLDQQARVQAEQVPFFEELSDFLQVRVDQLEAAARVPVTGRMFALEGYIPSHLGKGAEKGLSEAFCVSVQQKPADRAEDYPILLKNNRLVRPYEAITEMFSLPQSVEVDPVSSIMPFYCLFFGMMFSDVAYGLIMALATGFLVWTNRVEGTMRKMCQVFFQCGLSSIIWGFLFGGFFGNVVSEFSGHKVDFPVLWMDPLKDPTQLMLWSVIFGTLHIFVGMAVKIHILFATGKWKEALFDVAPWYFILGGLGAIGGGVALHQDLIFEIGKWMAIFGALVILLMAGRPSKNPLVRLFKGIGSLYGITGYFSDVMSYTRILALALSTAVIAMVVNLLSLLPGKSVLGLIFFVVVALVGHLINFALSALSAYVHTTRLHYVEYFSKFFEGGGRPFAPLTYRTKYVQINRTEEVPAETEGLRKRVQRFRGAQE